jgi:hypothetical protein
MEVWLTLKVGDESTIPKQKPFTVLLPAISVGRWFGLIAAATGSRM